MSETPLQDAFLAAQRLREATDDLSAADVDKMPMDQYAAIRQRAGLPSVDPYETAFAPPGRERPQEPAQTTPPAPEPIDVGALSMTEYKAVRSRLIRPATGSGVGIFGNDN